MKTAFVTHCSDDWFEDGGCSKLVRSINYFHPTTPIYVFGTKELNELNKLYHGKLHWCNLNPVVSLVVAEKQKYDKVIHIDADSILLGDVTELLNDTADITVVRNNNDYNTASKFTDNPITFRGCSPELYANAGLVASNRIDFWKYWIELNTLYEQQFPYREQDVLNYILQENKFNYNFIDNVKKKVHYGISCHYGSNTFWDSSKEIEISENGYKLKDKIVKVWHQAGGSHYFPKLQLDKFFSEKVVNEIKNTILKAPLNYIKPNLGIL